jgi:hypothetical protein
MLRQSLLSPAMWTGQIMQPARACDVAPRRGPMDDSGRRSHPISASIKPAMQKIKNGPPEARSSLRRGGFEILTLPLVPPAPPSARAIVAAMITMRTTAATLGRNARRRSRDRYPFDSSHSLQRPICHGQRPPPGPRQCKGNTQQRERKPARDCMALSGQYPCSLPIWRRTTLC